MCVITLSTFPNPAPSSPQLKRHPIDLAKGHLRAKCSDARGEEVRHLSPAAFDLV